MLDDLVNESTIFSNPTNEFDRLNRGGNTVQHLLGKKPLLVKK